MNLFLRVVFGLLFGVTFIFVLNSRQSREEDDDLEKGKQRYLPYIAGALLPSFLVALLVMLCIQRGLDYALEMLFSISLPIFFHIALYFILLSLLMPLLRRNISSRACAMLWLLPTYLYLIINNDGFWPDSPRVIFSFSRETTEMLCLIWFVGFAGVLGWKILSHFLFRCHVLRDAHPPEVNVQRLWRKEIEKAGFKKDYTIMVSPQVNTPLSIGWYHWSIRVLLPERTYTEEELTLIFRHELIHIGREDSVNKFFLMFCTAMCWFNPLMWWAMRRSAEDMELSCDETVLLDADDETRQRYARLLLSTAGDSRGFTTCLSAAASSLRYRLKSVLHAVERESGSLVLLFMFLLFVISFGYVAVGYEQLSGHELLFGGGELSDYTVINDNLGAAEAEELTAYLAGLEFEKVTGNDHDLSGGQTFEVRYSGPQGGFWLIMTEEEAMIVNYSDDTTSYVRVRSEIDWDYLDAVPERYPYQGT